MDIRFQNASGGEWHAACCLVPTFEGRSPEEAAPALARQAPWMGISPGLRDFTGKKDSLVLLYGHPELPVPRIMLVGLGKEADVSLENFRLALAKAVQACRRQGFSSLGLPVESLEGPAAALGVSRDDLAREGVVAARLCLYRAAECRSCSAADDEPDDPRWLALLCTEPETPDSLHAAARRGEAEAGGVLFARRLVNGPANLVTPETLAAEAREMAERYGFGCRVLGPDDLRERGMGALWAVGQGSPNQPRLVVLEHCPQGAETDKPLVLVGKGITFDTGGISLKPSLNMHEMKGDMGGGAAVLGFFEALGRMPDKDACPRVIGVVPACENMPDGQATRPGDVVTTCSGKTVEILNTDAEGRLILADAMAYAQQEWTPAALIDISTLTGACVIALGDLGAGLFTKDDELRDAVLEAAAVTGDLFWPLPLWEAYDGNLKSNVADMANMGTRDGASIQAALFLQRFIENDTRWAHLDIAGPGYVTKTTPLHPMSGGTGVGVRLFCLLVRSLQGR